MKARHYLCMNHVSYITELKKGQHRNESRGKSQKTTNPTGDDEIIVV